jgi:hypothetical protein
VRSIVGVVGLALSLSVVGCKSAPPKPSDGGTNRPFVPRTDTAPAAAPAPESSTAESNAYAGILAGQVQDKFNRRMPEATLRVVDLQDPQKEKKAELKWTADTEGYFTIQGLRPGHTYQLTVSAQDGKRVLSNVVLATPPNPRLSIYLDENLTSPSTPAPLGPPAVPEKEKKPEQEKKPTPSASLEPPVRNNSTVDTPKPENLPPTPTPTATTPIDKSQIANGVEGFQKGSPTDPRRDQAPMATIPGQRILPPPPGSSPVEPPPERPRPSTGGNNNPGPMSGSPKNGDNNSSGLMSGSPKNGVPIPSCVVVGGQLYSFALYDAWGKRWEYPRNRTGRIMLLEFWQSDNGESLEMISSLKQIQADYGDLEIVSVAYESADREPERRMAVRGTASRYGVKYHLLMAGGTLTGGVDRCPLAKELRIDRVPTLLLVNDRGREVWRSREGIDERQIRELRQAIARSLID